jgi:exosortase/archaeosortase family protein
VLVLACFPIAILVNALRVSATGILANYYGLSVAEGFFHGFSGYVLFIVAFLLLLALGFLLSKLSR